MTGGRTITGQFWRYALPSMFSQLLNSFFIIVDGFFVGQNLGDAGLAAINVAWPLVAVIQAARLAIGTGGAVRLATALGRGEEEEAPAGAGATPWCCWPGGGPAGRRAVPGLPLPAAPDGGQRGNCTRWRRNTAGWCAFWRPARWPPPACCPWCGVRGGRWRPCG